MAEAPQASGGAALRLFVGAGTGAEGATGAPAPATLAPGAEIDLPAAAAAHVKVRRLQPGAALRLFDGDSGADWPAVVQAIGRGAVRVRLAEAPIAAAAAELPLAVALAFAMPANERVDALVEKATELGAAALWPLMSERSVLRLHGERAERRRAHWQAVAAAASEQCGRARVPRVQAVQSLAAWLRGPGAEGPHGVGGTGGIGGASGTADISDTIRPSRASAASRLVGVGNAIDGGGDASAPAPLRWLLSTRADAPPVAAALARAVAQAASAHARLTVLSGPEGGLTPAEHEAARAAGFVPVSLGPRILRADTAPLAALAWLGIALGADPGPKAGA